MSTCRQSRIAFLSEVLQPIEKESSHVQAVHSRRVCRPVALCGSTAFAQCGCNVAETAYAPVATGYTTYYAPPVTYYPAATNVTCYTPEIRVTYYTPVSHVSYYTPAVRYATYYSSPVIYDGPVVQAYPVYYGAPRADVLREPPKILFRQATWGEYLAPRLRTPFSRGRCHVQFHSSSIQTQKGSHASLTRSFQDASFRAIGGPQASDTSRAIAFFS